MLGEGGVIVDAREEEEEEEWVTDDSCGDRDDGDNADEGCDASDGEELCPLPLPARRGVRFAEEQPVFADDRSAASSTFR